MKVIVDGKEEKIRLDNKIGEGTEGKVYFFNNITYKIYYPGALQDGFGLKEKHHAYLLDISTRQIILPTNLIYNNFGRYIGYTAPFIKKEKLKLLDIEKTKFIKNLEILENDIEILSNKKVLMADIKYYNFIYNGDMYIIDPGRYRINFDYKVYENNIMQYKKLILYLIENEMNKCNLGASKITKKIDQIKQEIDLPSKYFKEEMKFEETLRQYVKRKH